MAKTSCKIFTFSLVVGTVQYVTVCRLHAMPRVSMAAGQTHLMHHISALKLTRTDI